MLRYAKQLLPTYNIFDELRHFAPGPDVARVLRIGSHAGRADDLRGRLERRRRRLRRQPVLAPGRRRARPRGVDQREPVGHRQARDAPPGLRRRLQAPRLPAAVRQPGRRPGHRRVRRRVVRGRCERRRLLRGAALRRGRRRRCAFDDGRFASGTGAPLAPVDAEGPVDDGVLPRADRAGPARLRAPLRLLEGRDRLVGRHRQRADAGAGGRRARRRQRRRHHDAVGLLVGRLGRRLRHAVPQPRRARCSRIRSPTPSPRSRGSSRPRSASR